eukprot:364246-Chlamydomonas_euryale.AAC.14
MATWSLVPVVTWPPGAWSQQWHGYLEPGLSTDMDTWSLGSAFMATWSLSLAVTWSPGAWAQQ